MNRAFWHEPSLWDGIDVVLWVVGAGAFVTLLAAGVRWRRRAGSRCVLAAGACGLPAAFVGAGNAAARLTADLEPDALRRGAGEWDLWVVGVGATLLLAAHLLASWGLLRAWRAWEAGRDEPFLSEPGADP